MTHLCIFYLADSKRSTSRRSDKKQSDLESGYKEKSQGTSTSMVAPMMLDNKHSSMSSKQLQQGDQRVKPFVYVLAVTSAISGVLFGYDIGGSGGTYVMSGFREFFHWPTDSTDPAVLKQIAEQQGWVPAMFTLGCIFGTIPSGYLVDRFGRKGSITWLTFLFTIGAVIQLFPMDISGLYCGRFICGLAVGALSMASTLYQSETAPACVRGLVITIQQLAITFGILLAGALNVALQHWKQGWRISYGGNVVFSIVLFITMFFLPESPRWLVSKGREEEAAIALGAIRFKEEVEGEMCMIRQAVQEERALQESEGSWKDLFCKKELMSYRTTVGFLVQFLQQFTGKQTAT